MRNLIATIFTIFALAFSTGAFAQPTPPPDPWVNNGNSVSYALGPVIVGVPSGSAVTGAGNINISGAYSVNGVPIASFPCTNCAVTNATNVFTAYQRFNLNAASLDTAQTGTILQLGQADSVAARIELDSYGAASFHSCVRADGTKASPTTLVANDEICSINAWGFDGTSRAGPAAGVRQYAAGTWSNTSHPTFIDFATTAVSSTTETSRMHVENDGGITIGGAASQGAGTLNLLNSLYANGTAPSGTDGYVRTTAPTVSSLTVTTAFTATGLVTYADMASAAIATTANYLSGASSVLVPASVIYTSETTTTFGTTTTFDFSTFINTVVTLTGNISTQTLSNVKAGQSGQIRFIQDGTGSRTTVWNSIFKFAGGVTPALSTAANAIDLLFYSCSSATLCYASLVQNMK